MERHSQECARAVLLTPDGFLLLMKIQGWTRELWITPGGRINAGEDPVAAVRRELREETGLTELADSAIVGPIWFRNGTFFEPNRRVDERETFYLIRTRRFEPDISGFEAAERSVHRGFRWWSIEEIRASADHFVPAALADHLEKLRAEGAPLAPLDVSG